MLGFKPLTLAMISCLIIVMILCFLVMIYLLIQNRRLDAKIAGLMWISQSTNNPVQRISHTPSVPPAPAPPRPSLRTPGSYPSFSNYDLTVPDPSWETVEAPSELASQPNRIYSSVTFPRTRRPSLAHRRSFSNLRPHGTLEQMAQHYDTLSLTEHPWTPSRNRENARQVQELEHDQMEEISGSGYQTEHRNRLELWPPRSRLSSLIRQSHPHIILSKASLNPKPSVEFNNTPLTPTTSYLHSPSGSKGIR